MKRPRIKAGELRHTIELQRRETNPDGSIKRDTRGHKSTNWLTFAKVRIGLKTLNGTELDAAREQYAQATSRVVMRYCSDLRVTDRIKFGDRVLSHRHVDNVQEMNIRHELLVREEK